jgi:hypothetical protein
MRGTLMVSLERGNEMSSQSFALSLLPKPGEKGGMSRSFDREHTALQGQETRPQILSLVANIFLTSLYGRETCPLT